MGFASAQRDDDLRYLAIVDGVGQIIAGRGLVQRCLDLDVDLEGTQGAALAFGGAVSRFEGYAWGAAELRSARSCAGGFGNPPRVPMTNLPSPLHFCGAKVVGWGVSAVKAILVMWAG
jgi:hypothetical protein